MVLPVDDGRRAAAVEVDVLVVVEDDGGSVTDQAFADSILKAKKAMRFNCLLRQLLI